MSSRSDTTISGRALVIGGVIVAVLTVAASLVWGPDLRDDVRQAQGPRTLRDPVASGRYDGQVWEAVGRFDGDANCVELRFRGAVVDRACDVDSPVQQTPLPPAGPVIAYGIAGEEQRSVTVTLDDGTSLPAPTVAGDLGFPVSFWAVELPAGRSLESTDAQIP